MYDLKLQLCRAYPGLNPLSILDYPLVDVLDLIVEHIDHSRRALAIQDVETPQQRSSGKQKVIYRRADDSWF